MKAISRIFALLVWVIFLSGCPVGPDYKKPVIPVPTHWAEGKGISPTRQLTEWWKYFNDPVLNRLIEEAAATNLNLQQASTRILQARAQKTVAVSAGLPNINAHSNVSRRYNNFQGFTGSGSGGGGPGFIDIFQSGFDVSWEIDLFGGIRRNIEATEATIEAETENRRDVLVTLLAEVARLYIDMRANQQLIAITGQNLATQDDTLGLTQARAEAGLSSELEVAQQASQAATTRSQLPIYEIASKQSAHALAVLLGKPPESLLYLTQQTEARIPVATKQLLAVLPSELLQRRPDIRQAERQLAASTAMVGVATADLYPKMNLTAFAGLQNPKITDLIPVSKSWNVASSVTLPIFNWGRIRATIDSNEAERVNNQLAYKNAILMALKEVEDGLVSYTRELERKNALEESVRASQLALKLADERFQRGLSDFLNVLEAQRALFAAQSNLISSEARVSTALIAIYKAMGGDWKTAELTDTR